jgi:hypothetical protein
LREWSHAKARSWEKAFHRQTEGRHGYVPVHAGAFRGDRLWRK